MVLILLAGSCARPGIAHESEPGLLEIRQLTTERWELVWRAPIYYGRAHPARLALPPDWQPVGEASVQRLASADLHRRIVEVPPGTVDGSVIGFPGLEQTITDVFVRLARLDGSQASQVVRPTRPEAVLRGEIPLALAMFNVGVELGQLAFVILVLLSSRAVRILEFRWPRWAELGPAYTVGSLGAYWTIQRTVMML
ncbi:MAG: hypothetical protein V2I24_10595 [Halieaceae bacterium]|jgi:hypothetical protein|nr:hypothetical protein [Halieaceae bacterium]